LLFNRLLPNFVKQIKQAILLRSIQKQEKLLISTLKHKLHEDTALDGDDYIIPDSPDSMASVIPDESSADKQLESSKPGLREGSGLQDRTTDRLKFKPK
jgi:hypothetical protein